MCDCLRKQRNSLKPDPYHRLIAGLILLWIFTGLVAWHRPVAMHQLHPTPTHFLISLNQAPASQLALLPGIGRQLAQRIVRFRMKHGPFANVQDMTQVPGIGPKTLARLRPYLKPIHQTDP